MAGQLSFYWRSQPAIAHAQAAAIRALTRLQPDAHEWWLVLVPVRTGRLRDSWFAFIEEGGMPRLIFGAATPYLLYVEFGTMYMTPRAPIRATAAEVFPFLEGYLRQEMAA